MNTLTERRMRVLRFVDHFRTDYGYPPAIREIGAAIDLPESGTHYHVRRLIDAGLLRCEDGKPRTLRLTDAGRAAIAEPEQ